MFLIDVGVVVVVADAAGTGLTDDEGDETKHRVAEDDDEDSFEVEGVDVVDVVVVIVADVVKLARVFAAPLSLLPCIVAVGVGERALLTPAASLFEDVDDDDNEVRAAAAVTAADTEAAAAIVVVVVDDNVIVVVIIGSCD